MYQVFVRKVLVVLSFVLISVEVILEGESDENVSGQWISRALFWLSHSFVLLSVLHLLARFVLVIDLIIVLMGRSICVLFHLVEMLLVKISFSLIVMGG